MKKFGRHFALASAIAFTGTAHAAMLEVISDADTLPYTLPATNDYHPLSGVTGQVGAQVAVAVSVPIKLTFQYLFKEASLANSFWVNDTEIFNTKTSSFGDSFSIVWNGGNAPLDFKFLTGIGVDVSNDPTSGSQNDGAAKQKFFTALSDAQNYILLGLDDSGARQDADHDDMVIRISAASLIPEPATAALLGLGLLGFAMSTRKSYRRLG